MGQGIWGRDVCNKLAPSSQLCGSVVSMGGLGGRGQRWLRAEAEVRAGDRGQSLAEAPASQGRSWWWVWGLVPGTFPLTPQIPPDLGSGGERTGQGSSSVNYSDHCTRQTQPELRARAISLLGATLGNGVSGGALGLTLPPLPSSGPRRRRCPGHRPRRFGGVLAWYRCAGPGPRSHRVPGPPALSSHSWAPPAA